MLSTAIHPQAFSTPSWQIETKYSTKVLTGNWVEERRKFTKATEETPQSLYRKEYVPFPGHKLDQISRWYSKKRFEEPPLERLGAASISRHSGHRPPCLRQTRGQAWKSTLSSLGLPYKHLITHHQEPSKRYLISTYDDHYNRHDYNPGLPPLRSWNGHKSVWLPEKSDFPLLAPPTNYGLYEQLKQKWLASKVGPRERESIYTSSYPRPPLWALSQRAHAIPVPPCRLHPCLTS
ncbi:cilia- and flagella-associated protein 107 isoform X1 [Microcebus murinus]|uniref:cilia- and flagella-associated protein 107 isoform X1 n=1 Tax=Microcebus murinus TaxID=30608 RepID=UPI003F6D60B3